MAPNPSTLQSISWSPSFKVILFTFVPFLIGLEDPLTLRSFITITESPSFSSVPWASLIVLSSASYASYSAYSSGIHS